VLAALLSACIVAFAAASAFPLSDDPNDVATVANMPWVYALLAVSMLLLSAADPVMDGM